VQRGPLVELREPVGDLVLHLVLVAQRPVGGEEPVELLDLAGHAEGDSPELSPPVTSALMRSKTAGAIWVATVRFQISS
jgi:hypothetical protein